nr:MAG TPA: hypothetical protein [Caudoviricetes sp.]
MEGKRLTCRTVREGVTTPSKISSKNFLTKI